MRCVLGTVRNPILVARRRVGRKGLEMQPAKET